MMEKLLSILRGIRADLSDEKRTQADIEQALKNHGIEFEREVILSAGDRVDFMIGTVAVEVKLKGQRKKDVWKQLCRYAQHDRVTALVLVSNLSMGLPGEINGKPSYFVSLGAAE